MRSVDSATVHRRQLELPREICPVSLRRLREPRGNLTAGQKSAEGVVDHVVGKASEALGAADKAANLERWKSFFCQLPVFGQIAYPVRAEATTHDKPGCKSLGCPAETFAAVGAIWEASKLGGLNIKKCLQPRELARGKIAFAETNGKPT